MAYQITAEGGANLAPAVHGVIVAEGGGNLSPAEHGEIEAEGGADLSPSAPPVLTSSPIIGGAMIIAGNATVEIYDSATSTNVPRPIAGTYLPTGIEVEGKQTYTVNGHWPRGFAGTVVTLQNDPDSGWSIVVTYNGDGGVGWDEGAPSDLETPDLVTVWIPNATTTGSFTVTAGPVGVVAPPVIAPEGGVDLAPAAHGQIVPENPH